MSWVFCLIALAVPSFSATHGLSFTPHSSTAIRLLTFRQHYQPSWWGLHQPELKKNSYDGRSSIVFLKEQGRVRSKGRRKPQGLLLTNNDDENVVETKPVRLIISGAPASGKGTQCEIIRENFGVVHLSTGDMLRAAVAEETEVGKLAKAYMDAGKLVPDEVVINVVGDRLKQADCKSRGWLLDGFPRTRAQADALAASGVCADCFILLRVPDEVLVSRVIGRRTDPETGKIYHMTFSPPENEEVRERLVQRSDDTEEKVIVRLEQFHKNVDDVAECYANISISIDGTARPNVVSQAICKGIEEICGERVQA